MSGSIDYAALAEGLDEMREMLRMMVAALAADGFSDDQARDIIASIFRTRGIMIDEGEEDAG